MGLPFLVPWDRLPPALAPAFVTVKGGDKAILAYAHGRGFVLSADVARSIGYLQQSRLLSLSYPEDVTVAVWMLGMSIDLTKSHKFLNFGEVRTRLNLL